MSAKKGDNICILKGARVPFILRKTNGNNRFQVVGEAYVDGIMHGQLSMMDLQMKRIILV